MRTQSNNIHQVQSEFASQPILYFDNAATTIVSPDVVKTVNHYMQNQYANAGSLHNSGQNIKKMLNKARLDVSQCINSEADQIIFTSGGSESNSLVITGILDYLKQIHKPCIITSTIEHPSVSSPLDYISQQGILVIKVPVDKNGMIDINRLRRRISHYNIGLVSIMAVNNELGCIQDLEKIGELCKENNILFHTDCVQAPGVIDIDVKKMNIDFLSMSGHKFHAPKGVGFIYASNKDVLKPIIYGGGQEFSLRSGTENTPGIIGMAQALKNINKSTVSYTEIKKCFVDKIEEICDKLHVKVYFNGDSKTNPSKIVNMRFPGIDGQALVLLCSLKNVYISAGSACKSNSNEPSHVLKAIGLTNSEARSSIRVSFSKYNTIEEVVRGAEIIVQCVNEIKTLFN